MVSVAIQGEKGAFSELAAEKYFGKEIKISPSFYFVDVFKKVENRNANYGIVPIENSLYGTVFDTLDLLTKSNLYIIGEMKLQINHHLLALKKKDAKDIKKIYSHPQALGQCSNYLSKLKKIELIPSYDTAGSAKLLKLNNEIYSAAIASTSAAKLYGLKIIDSKIQNNKNNFTRFIVLSKKQNISNLKQTKTSICFELKSIPGALFKALSVFALRDIDLVKIESRPIVNKTFQYLFYVDIIGNIKSQKIKHAINHLKEISISVRIFGSYKLGKYYKG